MLSITVNGVPLQGRALIYKGRVYVAIEDLAEATGGTSKYDAGNRTLQATIREANSAPATPSGARPLLKVESEKKVVTQSNATVFATLRNTSKTAARNLKVDCTFSAAINGQTLGVTTRQVEELAPGRTVELEFRLFPDVSMPYTGAGNREGVLRTPEGETRVNYALKMDYQ